MTNIPCQYAIVRFAPYVETGEFANVGIILMAPKARYFGFKLLVRRHGRVTKFFPELEAGVFRSAMGDLKNELDRLGKVLKEHGFDRRFKSIDIEFANRLFAELIRPREVMVRFSEPRVVLAQKLEDTLKNLFDYYVERNFVDKEYREAAMENGIKQLLLQAHIGDHFVREHVGDEEYRVVFPFVELKNKQPEKIIKPLNLYHEDSSKIIERGGRWQFRIRELKKRSRLPEKVLFAVEGPAVNDKREHAYHEALEMLGDTGVIVSPYENQGEILDFARGG